MLKINNQIDYATSNLTWAKMIQVWRYQVGQLFEIQIIRISFKPSYHQRNGKSFDQKSKNLLEY